MRLQKYLANCGVASRRKSELLIQQGRVIVNGQIITEMGFAVDPTHDEVQFDNKVISPEKRRVIVLINKPKGYVTTNNDQFDRKTVADLVSDIPERLVPVGRLDYHSSGLLLLTNDGDLTYYLTHPKHHIPKVYLVKIDGILNQQQIDQFNNGMVIDDYRTRPAELTVVKKTSGLSVLKITLHEGRNRQIRKMIELLGYNVLELERIAIGKISDSTLKPGEYRHLTKNEIESLKGD